MVRGEGGDLFLVTLPSSSCASRGLMESMICKGLGLLSLQNQEWDGKANHLVAHLRSMKEGRVHS